MATNSEVVKSGGFEGPTVLASAPAGKSLTAEEREKLFSDLRDRMGESRLKVVAPAGVHVVWARKDDVSELARLEYLGYQVVHDDPKKPVYRANGLRQDGTYIQGDVILMWVHEEVWQFLQQEQAERSTAYAAGFDTNFQEAAGKAKIPTFNVDKKSR